MGKGERKERYLNAGCWLEFQQIRDMWKEAGLAPSTANERAEAEMEWKYFDGPEPPRYRDDDAPPLSARNEPEEQDDEPARWEEVGTDDVPQSEIVKWVQMQYIAAKEIKRRGGGNLINKLVELDPPPPNRAALGMLEMAVRDKDFIFEVYKMAAKMISGEGAAERTSDDGRTTFAVLQELAREAAQGLESERGLAVAAEQAGG